MDYMIDADQLFLLVNYLEIRLENGEAQDNTQAAIRTDIPSCLCYPEKINKSTKKQISSA